MKKVRVLSIFGTRPEAIKMAPLIIEMNSRQEFESIVCVTAQHRQMLDPVLKAFRIEPDFDLDIMIQNQSLFDITSKVLIKMKAVIEQVQPDIVLVQGDTTTAFASALAAYYCQTKIGHVEAGLRTWNKYSPFPEEVNRQMIGAIADFNFAPTVSNKEDLIRENKDEKTVFVTGNTVIDALKTTVRDDYYHEIFDFVGNDRLVLLTAHRRENLGKPMKNIFRAVKRIAERYSDVKVVYPVHLNPRVKEVADEIFADSFKIKLIAPLDVIDFHNIMNKSYLILTDSGGVQEEAPSLGKPVIVLRDTTERQEGILVGTAMLVGTNEEDVFNSVKELLENKTKYESMSSAINPYGDGMASKRIADILTNYFFV